MLTFTCIEPQQQNKSLNLPVLGSFWGTALCIVLIPYVRLLFLSQGAVVQTVHETCNSLNLHCQKSWSPCPTQSSLNFLIEHPFRRYCQHCVAFGENSGAIAYAVLKLKKNSALKIILYLYFHLANACKGVWCMKHQTKKVDTFACFMTQLSQRDREL